MVVNKMNTCSSQRLFVMLCNMLVASLDFYEVSENDEWKLLT